MEPNLENLRHGFYSEWAQLSYPRVIFQMKPQIERYGQFYKGVISIFTIAVGFLNSTICLSDPGIWGLYFIILSLAWCINNALQSTNCAFESKELHGWNKSFEVIYHLVLSMLGSHAIFDILSIIGLVLDLQTYKYSDQPLFRTISSYVISMEE